MALEVQSGSDLERDAESKPFLEIGKALTSAWETLEITDLCAWR